ncbi:MAG: hypothetical protein H7X89_03600 [Rhizobiales bacterium]|nr:hypothetical protein [Hyphomicrobiales bacterium]
MRKFYWFAAAIFLALGVHAAFVLAMPGFMLKRSIARISGETGTNAFFVLPVEEQSRLFPSYPPLSVTGACAFDVSDGPVDFSADMPAGFWTLTIYSSSGNVIYALNDTQAGTAHFTVNLKKAPGLLDMLTKTTLDDRGTMTGWSVSTGEPTGLAVLWQPVADAALRPGIVRSFGKTICKPVG